MVLLTAAHVGSGGDFRVYRVMFSYSDCFVSGAYEVFSGLLRWFGTKCFL
jgi:hypothetical protein